MVKRCISLCVIFLAIQPVFADLAVGADISVALVGAKRKNQEISTFGGAHAQLSFKSVGNNNLKSQLHLTFSTMRSLSFVTIDKAFIKFRFPSIRVTLGKNRISWGDGIAFNAGDVLFDDYGANKELDLTADELKSLNRTMVLLSVPLGRFTFLEGIYLPYDFFSDTDLGAIAAGKTPSQTAISKNSFGGRFVTRLAGIKLETGYVYNGFLQNHKPYVSFNGTLLADYHLSASTTIAHTQPAVKDWDTHLTTSAGIFYPFYFANDHTLTTRVEAHIKPFAKWHSETLLLYPEITFIPNEELSLFVRAIINPIQTAIKNTIGLNWKTYEGFTISSFITNNSNINELECALIITHRF